MHPNHDIIEFLKSDDFETANATDSTQGRAGGAILEIGAWVYK
ncbi:hypothetical protein [Cupriavidus sp. CP313]